MNDVNALRDHMFGVLEDLKSGKIDIKKAKAMSEVSEAIINIAKAEIEFAKVNGNVNTQFFHKSELPKPTQPAIENKDDQGHGHDHDGDGSFDTPTGKATVTHHNGMRMITHRLK